MLWTIAESDRTIKLWDTETWRCFNTFKEHTSWVWLLAFSPDGIIIASQMRALAEIIQQYDD